MAYGFNNDKSKAEVCTEVDVLRIILETQSAYTFNLNIEGGDADESMWLVKNNMTWQGFVNSLTSRHDVGDKHYWFTIGTNKIIYHESQDGDPDEYTGVVYSDSSRTSVVLPSANVIANKDYYVKVF